jgi:hypothetical protein
MVIKEVRMEIGGVEDTSTSAAIIIIFNMPVAFTYIISLEKVLLPPLVMSISFNSPVYHFVIYYLFLFNFLCKFR